jgi:hypothetical protein
MSDQIENRIIERQSRIYEFLPFGAAVHRSAPGHCTTNEDNIEQYRDTRYWLRRNQVVGSTCSEAAHEKTQQSYH